MARALGGLAVVHSSSSVPRPIDLGGRMIHPGGRSLSRIYVQDQIAPKEITQNNKIPIAGGKQNSQSPKYLNLAGDPR